MAPGPEAIAQARALLAQLRSLAAQHDEVLASYERQLEAMVAAGPSKLGAKAPNKRPLLEPEGPEAKKQRIVQEQFQRRQQLWHECYKILERCRRNQKAEAFKKPVDFVRLRIPDYPLVVKHPMDLQTVGEKLKNKLYQEPNEFAADMRLIWDNAIAYNGRAHFVGANALAMSEFFDKAWMQTQIDKQWAVLMQQEELSREVGGRERGGAGGKGGVRGARCVPRRRCRAVSGAGGRQPSVPVLGRASACGAAKRTVRPSRPGATHARALSHAPRRLRPRRPPPQALGQGNLDSMPSSDLPRQLKDKREMLGHYIACHDYNARMAPGSLGPCEPGREMTFEERRRLSAHLTQLPADRLQAVLDLLEQLLPVGGPLDRAGVAAPRARCCAGGCHACPASAATRPALARAASPQRTPRQCDR
jgi:hypothetical protein